MKVSSLSFLFLLLISSNTLSSAVSGCVTGNCVNGFGEYRYRSGSSYTGFWKDGIRYGRGVYQFADGSRFTGNYANDRRHGAGTYTAANGQEMKGYWSNGRFVNAQRLKDSTERTSIFTPAKKNVLAIKNAKRPSTTLVPAAKNLTSGEKSRLRAEAMKLIKACTGYTDDTIKALHYLNSVPNSNFDELYFKFRAYNTGSYKRSAGVLELTLKFKKYHNGAYEQGIDSGQYYWNNCDKVL